MSVPGENFTKCTLLVQRSRQALIDYYTILFLPHSSFIGKNIQERERDRQRDTERDRERVSESVSE